jgi:hypothetical protein
VQDGWLRFRLSDTDYRQLAGEGRSAIVTVDRDAGHILGRQVVVAVAGGHDGKPLDYAELKRWTRWVWWNCHGRPFPTSPVAPPKPAHGAVRSVRARNYLRLLRSL